jgi:hypothetical protein
MVSEGVDIPRLAVGVYATNTMTDLFFRQAVGRLVRVTQGDAPQRAYMFIPDDPRLREFALGIAEQRRHSLRKPEKEGDEEGFGEEEREPDVDPGEQMSLFNAISATALDAEGNLLDDTAPVDVDGDASGAVVPHVGASSQVSEANDIGSEAIPGLVGDEGIAAGGAPFALTADVEAPMPEPEPIPEAAPSAPVSRRSRKRTLRERNSTAVRSLVHKTGISHSQVNAELNRKAGIKRITEATVDQLERRLGVAERWLRRL